MRHEEGAGCLAISCPDELTRPTTACCTSTKRMESDDGGDGYGEPDITTAKAKPCTPHPCKNRKVTRRSVRLEPSWMKLDSSSSDGDVNRMERSKTPQPKQGRRKDSRQSKPPVMVSSSVSDSDDYIQSTQPRHTLNRRSMTEQHRSKPSGPNSGIAPATTDGRRRRNTPTSGELWRKRPDKSYETTELK